ncbi:hypothetical protein I7I50_07649 [Histoplasma capsulatum G186AR]|uniref:Uncharacterized protein n=1 Tax=Ajellomyces capsulatus TaxID=5037 RepID=A0A8H8D2X5_AJECA|nr:hypothetical protein I7I52_09279 [Histoplasma capsulatum]QSS68291.1 hypothetical protein I7I50_07649 [Histoplasma capsulatum G186AR]
MWQKDHHLFHRSGKKAWEMKPSPIIVESTHRCRESTLLFMIDGSLSRDLMFPNQGFIHVDHMKGFHLVLTIFLFLSLPPFFSTPYLCDSPFLYCHRGEEHKNQIITKKGEKQS